ncbi:EthD family reductase [Ruicaihuangia caeni]|uniref:EthD family reductase n=1 Tax=Ruicaihuangia caeni TaxID=3042517 RepID=A0AAW6TAB2_9MICO|nr:EthD family reductase [Klugiella sp. YN-L-19]MDI2098918.1 EthD family reductase [Klugiella sp. YN-L-19]
MYDVFAIYDHPSDPEAFNAHYERVHAPLTRRMPGLLEFEWGVAAPGSSVHVIARMTFADEASADAGLTSPEGTAAVEDLQNFAAAGVTVIRAPRALGTAVLGVEPADASR